ncbi:MAG: hypothetical protein LAP85_12695 [Acidobacteriia bacterium]|nr:hypothetical protein [Terriglobia bacterium]
MLTSKRQEWILQMIKGPDITPVGNCPGHYTSKSTISITADDRQLTIRPTDVLDLSNPQFLVVHFNDRESTIPWDRISNLDFEEQEVATTKPLRTAAHRMLSFPLGKKVV